VRDVKRKKWLLLFSLLAVFSPLSVFGEERDDQVGISFKAEQPVDPKEPTEPTEPKEPAEPKDPTPYDPDPSPSDEPRWITPFNNVLPLTLGSARNYYAQESHKNLPKTGELHQAGMQWTGFLCVACSFWLFLFTRLREEDDNEQEN